MLKRLATNRWSQLVFGLSLVGVAILLNIYCGDVGLCVSFMPSIIGGVIIGHIEWDNAKD